MVFYFKHSPHDFKKYDLFGGFNPLKNMKVRWDDYSQYMKKMFQTTNQILFAMIYNHYNLIKRSLVRKLPSYGRMSLASRAVEALDLIVTV